MTSLDCLFVDLIHFIQVLEFLQIWQKADKIDKANNFEEIKIEAMVKHKD